MSPADMVDMFFFVYPLDFHFLCNQEKEKKPCHDLDFNWKPLTPDLSVLTNTCIILTDYVFTWWLMSIIVLYCVF